MSEPPIGSQRRQPSPNEEAFTPLRTYPASSSRHRPAPIPPEQEEILIEVLEEDDEPLHPPREPSKPGKAAPPVPSEDTYDDLPPAPLPPPPGPARTRRPVPPIPQEALPPKPKTPQPAPARTRRPMSALLEEGFYEEIYEHPDSANPLSQEPPRRRRRTAFTPPGFRRSGQPAPQEEVYEDVSDDPAPPVRSPVKPRVPVSIPTPTKPTPPRHTAPSVPSHARIQVFPPQPKAPVNEETYEMSDMTNDDDDENYLEMDEDTFGSPPALFSRPGARRPPMPPPESESEDEDYLNMEDEVDIAPPPRTEVYEDVSDDPAPPVRSPVKPRAPVSIPTPTKPTPPRHTAPSVPSHARIQVFPPQPKAPVNELTEIYRRVEANVLRAPISSSSAPVPESQQNLRQENVEHDTRTYSGSEVQSISAMAEKDTIGDENEIPPMAVVIAKANITDNADSRLSVYRGEVIYLIEQQREYGEWKAKTHDLHGLINISSVSKFDLNSLREAPKIVTADLLPYCLSGTFTVFLEAGEANFTYNNHGDIIKEKLDISGVGSDDEILDQLQKFIWKNRTIFRFYIDEDNAVYCNQFLNSNRHISKNGKRYPYIPDWYHGYVEKEHTETILGGMPTGTFLVLKDIPRQTFVLSVTDGTSLHHFPIVEKGGKVAFSKTIRLYESVTDLVEQCFVTPLFLDTGNEIHLARYISRYNKNVPDGFSTLDPYWTELYLQTLSEGTEKQKSIRLMIVGHEKVGKTTLSRNLMDISREGIVSTNGIDVHIETCEVADDGTWKRSVGPNVDSGMIERIANIMQSTNKPDPALNSSTPAQMNENEDSDVEIIHISESSQTDKTQHNTYIKFPYDTNVNTSKEIESDIDASKQTTERSHKKVAETTRPDGVVLPIENASRIIALTKSVEKPADKNVSIWDFGGQYIYYATHQLFHSPRAVYLLVLDLSKGLDEQVDYGNPVGTRDAKRDVQAFIKFWMQSIHTFVGSKSGEPPVILVGTHKDVIEDLGISPDEHSEAYLEEVRQLFDGTPLLYHIQSKQFFFDNLVTSKTALDELKATIVQTATSQSFWNQEFPARWVTLEYALREVQKPHLNFSQICEINSRSEVPIAKEDEIRVFLMYHHFQGNVVYFNEQELKDFIVLDPQWLIDAFKSIITSQRFCKVRSHLRNFWNDFEETGILKNELIEEVWREDEKDDFYLDRHMILKFLVRLGIMSRCRSFCDDTETVDELDYYHVPSLLPFLQTEQTIKDFIVNATATDLVLVFRFESSYISPIIYHRTTAAAMRRWAVIEICGTRTLYGNFGMYRLDVQHVGLTRLTDTTIELSVHNLSGEPIKGEIADCFRRFIAKIIDHELNRFHSTHVPQFVTAFRCSCTKICRRAFMTIEDLYESNSIPCLQSAPVHHINSIKAYKEWYVDADTLRKSKHAKTTLDDTDIGELAKAVGLNWKLLGISLGIRSVELERIQMDHPYSSEAQIGHMLRAWRRLAGDSATMEALVGEMKANPAVTIDWDVVKDVMDTCETDVKKLY